MAKHENGLGKGLEGMGNVFGVSIDEMLDEISSGSGENGSVKLPIDKIRRNPYQPRKTFDEEKLQELAQSIKEHGVFQPILVREAIEGYELVAGERRLRASKIAGLNEIPAIVVKFDEQQMMEISLLENIQREDLSPIEEALAYEELINKLDYTQEKLAHRLGKSRSNITNMLRLLKLPKELQDEVKKGKLSYGHARALLSLDDEKRMIELAEKTIKEGLSVRELEKLVATKEDKETKKKEEKKDPFFEDVRHRLENNFATKVDISKKAITIHFNGTDDLNRILEKIGMLEDSLLDD